MTAGSQLAGRYRLVEPLPRVAEGVWRVRDDIGDRDAAALELQLAPGNEQETLHQRSVRQVRDAAQLRHDSIMSVYDVVEHDGRPWIVTELVAAPSLDHLLRTRGPVTPVEAARIGLGVIEALQVADRSGVRHRDLTPLNVL